MAKKTVNSDIYNAAQLVDDVKSVFIPDETSETLAIGTYGYIGAVESHRLQTQIQMTGELSNEVFPSRARLERNVITHAIMANIDDINAVPAKMNVFIAIKESDIDENLNDSNNFVIDRECPIYIGDYEFHLEYSIILKQIYIKTKNANSYSATYIMDDNREVPTSTISNRYLAPPSVVYTNNDIYVYVTAPIAQVTHYEVNKKLVTSNIVDNKTLTFEFDDQLAYFDVEVEESDEIKYLQPVFEGSSVPDNNYKYYCWYQYIDTNMIRIRFERSSYMPGLNAKISCKVKTCKGSEGNFTYNESCAVALSSTITDKDTAGKYYKQYSNITTIVTPISNSSGGKDRKSKSELQKLIPKELLARGSLTTITDLNNYFSTLDSEDGRVIIQKKIDNQIERVYYAYLVAKDINGNVIPSNTIDVKIGMEDLIESKMTESLSSRFILKSGQCIKLDSNGVGYINHDPIMSLLEIINPGPATRGTWVTDTFQVKVTDSDVENIGVGFTVDNASTGIYVDPAGYVLSEPISSKAIEVEDYMLLSVGQTYRYDAEYILKHDGDTLEVTDAGLDCLEFQDGWYKIGNDTEEIHFTQIPFKFTVEEKNSKINISCVYKLNEKTSNRTTTFTRDNTYSKTYTSSVKTLDFDELLADMGLEMRVKSIEYNKEIFEITEDDEFGNYTLNILQDFNTDEIITVSTEYGSYDIYANQVGNIIKNGIIVKEYYGESSTGDDTLIVEGNVSDSLLRITDPESYVRRTTLYLSAVETSYLYTCYAPSLSHTPINEDGLRVGDIITYTVTYRSESSKVAPTLNIQLSEGLEYVPFSNYITFEDGTSYYSEPVEKNIGDTQFLYTNPYAISINAYHLYSAFYMMSMNENPYVHFDWVNEASNVQFIATNITWNKDFLGKNKDRYQLKITVNQSVQDDLGVIPEGGTPEIMAIAVFERNNKHYRYRTMDLESYDEDELTFTFSKSFLCTDILDNDNNIKVENLEAPSTLESGLCTYSIECNGNIYEFKCDGSYSEELSAFLNRFAISGEFISYESSDEDLIEIETIVDKEGKEEIITNTFKIKDQFSDDQWIRIVVGESEYKITISTKYLEYGYLNPTSDLKIYVLSKVQNVSSNPNVAGGYDKYDLETFCPLVDKNWTVTNIYSVVNGVSLYYNYSEIMGSRAIPYGTDYEDTETQNVVMTPDGYYVYSVPVLGYKYCMNEDLIQNAIDALNYRKGYIDNAVAVLENSFGVDFKLFNTYGPSRTFYIIRDENSNSMLDDDKEYINRVDLTLNFRVKLTASKDSYTKNNIIAEIKEYIEDLDDLSELHIPNLITQITTNYKEQVTYFEYLGFNNYGPEIQHIYKDEDNIIPIHTAPEFLSVKNVLDLDGTETPDINIYISEL